MIILSSFYSKLSNQEQACFNVVSKWKRVELCSQWVEAAKPTCFLFHDHSVFAVLLRLLLLPVSVLLFLSNLTFKTLAFPFAYFTTYLFSPNIEGVGERNIQGIHNRISPYISLSSKYYIHCVNEWVEILYGQRVAVEHSIECHIDSTMIESMKSLYGDDPSVYNSRVLADAREKLSRRLGNF